MPSIRPGDSKGQLNISGGPWNAKFTAEAVNELCNMAGYDFVVDPIFPPQTTYNNAGSNVAALTNVPKIGRLRLVPSSSAPTPGARTSQPPIFEYGTTRANVSSYSMKMDRDEQANSVYVPRVGFPEPGYLGTDPLVNSTNPTAIAAFGLLQAWVEPGDIYLSSFRTSLANTQRDLRMGPRRRVTFTPARNNVVQPFVDYNIGDWLRFRAFNGSELRFDIMVRIWAMDVSIDDTGNESVTVTTVENGG